MTTVHTLAHSINDLGTFVATDGHPGDIVELKLSGGRLLQREQEQEQDDCEK